MRIDNDVLIVLSSGESDGNVFKITSGQLTRDLYLKVNKVLETLGGKWNRKLKGHTFDDDPNELIDAVINTGEIGKKNPYEFYETPPELADRMVSLARLQPGERILEPCAGKGAIVDALLRAGTLPFEITAIECNSSYIPSLEAKGCDVLLADFLRVVTGCYDCALLNPPFSKGQAVDHVNHAYELLAKGGRLVAIMPSSIIFRQDKKHTALRELIETSGSWTRNPEGTFKESGTMVNTVTVVIDKPVLN